MESLHSRHVSALRSTPDQSCDSANQRELALDILAQIAHAFDFPDLHRFLTVRHYHYVYLCMYIYVNIHMNVYIHVYVLKERTVTYLTVRYNINI